MTSANQSDGSIAVGENARARLGRITDALLGERRPISRRCEDSLVCASFPIYRSRSFAPEALPLPAWSMASDAAMGLAL